MLQQKNGFSLIEILIIVTIFGILAIAVISSINPIEQIERGRDTARLQLIEHLFRATERLYANNKPAPWTADVTAASLESAQGVLTITNMIDAQELKMGFANGFKKHFPLVYLTAENEYQKRAFCFLPESDSFQDHHLAKYSKSGEILDTCPEEGCYLCFSTDKETEEESGPPADNSDIEEDQCTDFDPEYPNFAYTCNYSDRYSEWGCTNYCTHDLGCGDYCVSQGNCEEGCPEGQRLMVKNYYSYGDGFEECLSHRDETKETYCVPAPDAGCEIKEYRSDDSDFVYACTDPRRPVEWRVRVE